MKRPALYSGWENGTTLPVALAALDYHGLPREQYQEQLDQLTHEWCGALDSRFHWRMDSIGYTETELERASRSVRGVASYLDTLPPEPMPSKMKCKFCDFKTICPTLHEADFGDQFTTPAQRKAASERRAAAKAASAELDDASMFPTI